MSKREFTKAWSIYWWVMLVLIPSVGMSQVDRNMHVLIDRENMKRFSLGSQNLTKLNRMTSSICVRFSHGIWHMALVGLAYHWRTCLFELFENKRLQISSITWNKVVRLYSPNLFSQQLRLGTSICNPQNFQVHWQSVYIANRLKLKRTFVSRPDIIDKTEQSKTHPFNFHKKLKHSYRAW